MGEEKQKYQRRPLVSGIVWLGLGIYLLAIEGGSLPPVEQSWPVMIIVVGVALIAGSLVKARQPTSHNKNS